MERQQDSQTSTTIIERTDKVVLQESDTNPRTKQYYDDYIKQMRESIQRQYPLPDPVYHPDSQSFRKMVRKILRPHFT